MIGKWLIFIGCSIALIGVLIWIGGKMGVPFGHLPGDISVTKEKFSFSFPIATSIVISIVLTLLLNLFIFFFKK